MTPVAPPGTLPGEAPEIEPAPVPDLPPVEKPPEVAPPIPDLPPVAKPPVAKPPAKPAIVGTPLSVVITTGDKYITRTQLKDAPKGEYFQELLTRGQIEARGGFIPPPRVSILQVEAFAEEHLLSPKAAADTLTKFQRDPTDPEFAPLTTKEKESLLKIARPKDVRLVEVVKGQPKLLVGTAAFKKLVAIRDPEERFLAMQSMRLIPKGVEWLDPEMQAKAIKALEPYKTPEGTYRLTEAIEKKVTPAYLDIMFGKKAVKETRRTVAEVREQIKEVEAKQIKLADGKWVPLESTKDAKGNIVTHGWNDLPEKYQIIGLRQGFEAMISAIKADKARQDRIIATLDTKYQVDDGYNLPLALKQKAVTPNDLEFVGFEKKDVDVAVTTVKASVGTNVAVAGERNWLDTTTNKIYTDTERFALIKKSPQKLDELVLDPASGRRLGVQLASFVAPATRAALPEYTIKDISAIEWGLTGVNAALIGTALAPGAIMASLAGRGVVTGVATTGAGLLGYTVKKSWSKLSPVMRGVGVAGTCLYAVPMLATISRGISLSGVKIPITKGEAVAPPAWKGLSVLKNPVIGKSGGRWVIGGRNITLPEARLILEGYKPEMMLDTKVFANPKALAKAGFSQTQINFLTDSLKARNLFAGKKAPFLSKDALIEPTKYIDADELAIFLRQIVKYNKQVQKVDMLYGGTTIKAQLAPELRGWRQIHDLDMHTTFKLNEAKAFVNETIAILRRLPSKYRYRISPKSPVRIEKLVKGKWEHLNDLKSEHIDPKLQISDVPASKLDVTGTYSYGRMVAEPAVTVKYPGVGKIDIMALSESGVRKADTILRVRQIDKATAFRPPQRGIARPGVPKDAADYYVILQTYEKAGILEPGIADEWLKSWAKAMGYTTAQLTKVMPNLRKAALEVAGESPSNLVGYRYTPATSVKVSPGASPTISIQVPSSLGASVSSSLARQISKPVSLYALSPRARASISSTVSSVVPSGYPTMVSLSTMKGLSLSEKASVSARVQRVPPQISASPSPKPSPKVSPKVSPSIPPSVSPSVPPILPPPTPKPKPKPLLIGASDKEKRKAIKDAKGAVAWRHGELHGKDVWHVFMHPYLSKADFLTVVGRKPTNATIVKGPGSAYQTVKLLYGKPPAKKVTGDIGAFDFFIEPKTGNRIGIGFTPDPKQITTGDITVGTPKGTPPITERPEPITERRPALTERGKTPRITPRTPRLRR